MSFGKLAIVGVGLIGGSFAMAARSAGIAERISGWDDREILAEALRRGVIDEIEQAFDGDGICDADLIYLAAPVRGIIDFLETRSGRLKPGAVLTDAGSTKRQICRVAKTLDGSVVNFVGGHPMAGSHERGLAHARADLFRDAPYAIIADGPPANARNAEARALVIDAVRRLGARPIVMSAEEHDRAVAAVSHVPQLLSTALAATVAELPDEGSMLGLAGPGFAQMTRLAASHWSTWKDICVTNDDEIAMVLGLLIARLESMRDDLAAASADAIGGAFERANDFLRGLSRETPETKA